MSTESTTPDVLGPLWDKLSRADRELVIEFANGIAALDEIRPPGDDGPHQTRKIIAFLEAAGRRAGLTWGADFETIAAIIRRLIDAIHAGAAPPEADRKALRDHTVAVQLLVGIAQGPEGFGPGSTDEEIAESIREGARHLRGVVVETEEWEAEAVAREAIERVLWKRRQG